MDIAYRSQLGQHSRPPQKEASYRPQYTSGGAYAVSYNGETTTGEMGPAKEYIINYDLLRIRSWQAYMDNLIFRIIVNSYDTWIIAAGLRANAQPNKQALLTEGVEINTEAFNRAVESRWQVAAASTMFDLAGMNSLHKIASLCEINAVVGGDVLVVTRIINKQLKVELIDGCHLRSPMGGTEWSPTMLDNGNKIVNGIESDPSGQHVRYYVRNKDGSYQTIEARSKKTGLKIAWIYYGNEYRLNNNRGVPIMSTVLEKLTQLDDYSGAMLTNAKEVSKVSHFIEHQLGGDGKNPYNSLLSKAVDVSGGGAADAVARTAEGQAIADKVAVSTRGQVFNLSPGATIKQMPINQGQFFFKEFHSTHANILCACLEIPPNVAFMDYNGNFSASRAAIEQFNHNITKIRAKGPAAQFYQPIYELWLHLQVLQNRVSAPEYLRLFDEGNELALAAYRMVEFKGPQFPHIDPLKEVNAQRAMLGITGTAIPLTTMEDAVQALTGGNSSHIMAQYADELEESKELGIEVVPVQVAKTDAKKKEVVPAEEDDEEED